MKNVLGLLASGAATLALLISICIYDNVREYNILKLLALLSGGLCTFIRLMDVIGNKPYAMLIVGTAFLSGAFNFGAFVWNTERWVVYEVRTLIW